MGFVDESSGAGWDAAGSATIPAHPELARLDRLIDDDSLDAPDISSAR